MLSRKYSAFTVIEMLIVTAIMIILFGVGIGTFRSLQNANAVNEATLTITQDIRAAQRSAMLLERESNERWLYGIGIDFRNIVDPNHPRYTIFKFCAEEDYFNDSLVEHTSEIPMNENDSFPLNPVNCSRDISPGFKHFGRVDIETKSFQEYDILDFSFNEVPRFILFQSVGGKAFLYESVHPNSLRLLNYSAQNVDEGIYNFSDDSVHFELVVGGNIGPDRVIKVYPVSGIIYVDNLILRN